MSNRKTVRKYAPFKLQKQIKTIEQITELQGRADNLAEELMLDIIDGWTTGNEVQDFALLSCDGQFDPYMQLRYQGVSDIGLRKAGERILIVQQAEHQHGEQFFMLRNIYLATLRPAPTAFDLNEIEVRLPVEPNYLLWRELMNENMLLSGHRTEPSLWIKLGSLDDSFTAAAPAATDDNGIASAPFSAPWGYVLLPEIDRSSLFEKFGIDTDMLDILHATWIRSRTTTHIMPVGSE